MRALPSKPLSPERILVIRLSALGDVIQVLPAIEALSRLYPEARIDAVTESLSEPILRNHPRLHHLHTFPRTEIRREWRDPESRGLARERIETLKSALQRPFYDLVIDWQSNFRSAWIRSLTRHRHLLQLHPQDGGELPGWWPGWRPRHPAGRVHRCERALHLVRELGYRGPTPAGEIAGGNASTPVAGSAAPILLHPFVSAFGRFKEWPLNRWMELADQLVQRGETIWVSGTPAEREKLSDWVANASSSIQMAPETGDTGDLGRLVRQCRAVIAADTGVIHLSAMQGVPSVGLYGPKDPAVHGPVGPYTAVLRSGVPCSPCLLRDCEHSLCMSSLEVPKVLAGLDTLLEIRHAD